MPYKDKDKQKEANREKSKRYRTKSSPPVSITPSVTPTPEFTATEILDAQAGLEAMGFNPVPMTDHETLELWADGGSDPRQRQLGILNKQYDVIKHGKPQSILKGYVVNAKDVA